MTLIIVYSLTLGSDAQRVDELHQLSGLLRGRGTFPVERSVRIHRHGVPSLHALVSPRRHARRDDQVAFLREILRPRVQETNSTLHPAGLVAVHAAGDEHRWFIHAPPFGLDGEERVTVGVGVVVRQRTVTHDFESFLQGLELGENLGGVRSLRGLDTLAPLLALGVSPCVKVDSTNADDTVEDVLYI